MFRIRLQRQAETALRRWVSVPVSGSRLLSTVSVEQTAPERLKIPPNLSFDPRCSFAPDKLRAPPPQPVHEIRDDRDYDNDQDEVDEGAVEELGNEQGDTDRIEDDDDDALYLPTQEILYATPLPDRLKVEVHTLFAPEQSTLTGTIHLDASVFGMDPIRVDLIKRAVNYYRARKRGRRKAKTKTISEVSGSGRKVRQQKGSGKARAGHSRPPHWRGGAKAHGPKNTTDYGNTKLNKKVRRLAMRHMLSQKLKENNMIVLNQLNDLQTHKTGQLARLLKPWGLGGKEGISALILDHFDDPKSFHGLPPNLEVASRNIPKLTVAHPDAANVWEVLKYEKLVITLAAVEQLEKRLAMEL